MKKTMTFLACLLLTFCFILSGCTTLELPQADAKVYGNGGTVVQKGDYVYFANAYTGYSTIGSDVSNKTGEADVYSLYRAKVSSDSSKNLQLDTEGFVSNAELIVSKVVGFENSNLYIVGNYLYFSSPNMHKTSSNQNKYDLISIFKVKLDGQGLKELYTTEDYTNGAWAIFSLDNKNFVVTVENKNIIRQEINKNGDFTNKTVLADNATKVVMPKTNTFANDNKIFFTCDRSEEDNNIGLTGNYLKSVEIANGTVKTLKNVSGETVSITTYSNGYLIYTKTTPVQEAFTYANNFVESEIKLTEWTGISNVYVVSIMNQGLKLIYTYQSKVVMQAFDSYIPQVLIDGDATIINIDSDYVYYTMSNKISRVSLVTKTATEVYNDENMQSVFDFDGRFIYLFSQVKDNTSGTKYLQRIDTFALEQATDVKAQPMGYVKLVDKPENK